MGCCRVLASLSVLAIALAVAGVVVLDGSGVRRLEVQTIHYMARPHENIRTTPSDEKAAWMGSELEEREEEWRETLSAGQVEEIDAAVDAAADACGVDINEELAEEELTPLLAALGKDQCPFGGGMAAALQRWKETLSVSGLGFRVIRGVPVERWTTTKAEIFFWCVGLHLGRTGAQNNEGHLLGHVRDLGGDHKKERQFKSKGAIAFHCDAADVVGLLALRTAKEGGTSRLASSLTVYNHFLAERPDLVDVLYEPTALDTRGGGGTDWVYVRPVRHSDGHLRTFWHEEYFATALELPFGPSQSERQREARALYSEILSRDELILNMELDVGDIQLCSNHVVLHSRSGFEDYSAEEDAALGVDRRRHLLRLWLSTEPPADVWQRTLKEISRLEVIAYFAYAKARQMFI